MRRIKAGIIGAGFIGVEHLEAVRRLGYVDVVALAARNDERAREKCERLNVPVGYGDWRDLVNDPEIEVVHNCTENNMHHVINKTALLAGKHVLSEKPLAYTVAEAEDLVEVAKKSGKVHGVCFNYRQYAQVQNARSMVERGDIGKINVVHGSYLQEWLLFDTDYGWRADASVSGESNCVADIGSHWADIVQHVTGQEIVEVIADTITCHPLRKRQNPDGSVDEVPIRTEDHANIMFRMSGGVKGSFSVSQISAGHKNHLTFEINGSNGSLGWDQEEGHKLWLGQRGSANGMMLAEPCTMLPGATAYLNHFGGHNEAWPDGMRNLMANFYGYVRDGKDVYKEKPTFATFEDGLRIMRIVTAIIKSAREQRWVKV